MANEIRSELRQADSSYSAVQYLDTWWTRKQANTTWQDWQETNSIDDFHSCPVCCFFFPHLFTSYHPYVHFSLTENLETCWTGHTSLTGSQALGSKHLSGWGDSSGITTGRNQTHSHYPSPKNHRRPQQKLSKIQVLLLWTLIAWNWWQTRGLFFVAFLGCRNFSHEAMGESHELDDHILLHRRFLLDEAVRNLSQLLTVALHVFGSSDGLMFCCPNL